MKRIVVGMVAIVMTLGATIAAVAGQTQTPTVTMQQSWTAWFLRQRHREPASHP